MKLHIMTLDELDKFLKFPDDQCKKLSEITLQASMLCFGDSDVYETFDLSILDTTRFEALGNMLTKCLALRSISLAGNPLDKLDAAHFQTLCDVLIQCKTLQSINLQGTNLDKLDADRFRALCNVLETFKALRTINLKGNKFNKLQIPLFKALCNTLAKCQTLHTIDLEYCKINALYPENLQILHSSLQRCEMLFNIRGIDQFAPSQQTNLLIFRDRLEATAMALMGLGSQQGTTKQKNPHLPPETQALIFSYAYPRADKKLLEFVDGNVLKIYNAREHKKASAPANIYI